jgi:hypothetical protein
LAQSITTGALGRHHHVHRVQVAVNQPIARDRRDRDVGWCRNPSESVVEVGEESSLGELRTDRLHAPTLVVLFVGRAGVAVRAGRVALDDLPDLPTDLGADVGTNVPVEPAIAGRGCRYAT